MELYIEPAWAKKDTKFKKGQQPWNKGRKGFTTSDEGKRRMMLENLRIGRLRSWETRDHNTFANQKATCVYDLEGNFLSVYTSINKAADAFGQLRENVRSCCNLKRGRAGSYQFRFAEIVEFLGEKMVKKSPIEPYKRGTRKGIPNKTKE